jgi:hypothetical protein
VGPRVTLDNGDSRFTSFRAAAGGRPGLFARPSCGIRDSSRASDTRTGTTNRSAQVQKQPHYIVQDSIDEIPKPRRRKTLIDWRIDYFAAAP